MRAYLVEGGVVQVGSTFLTPGLALDSDEVLLERDWAKRGVEVKEALEAIDAVGMAS